MTTKKMRKYLLKALTLLVLLSIVGTGCSKSALKAGTYAGSAEAHNGTLHVEVELTEDTIVSVTITGSEETAHLSNIPLDVIPKQIVADQSLTIDAVAGATVTSYAIRAAVADAITKAGGNPKDWEKPSTAVKSTEVVELATDVVVIGGGGAGLSAALSADERGFSVIMLEKTAMLGGHTALSGGYTLVTGSKLQRDLGVTNDTPQIAFDDNMRNGGNESISEILQVFTENMGVATDWTVDYINAPVPEKLTPLGENTVDRALVYSGGGVGLINALEAKLNESNVELYLNTSGEKLLSEDGVIVGVEAKGKDGTTYIIKADSVILATGGHGARSDLLPDTLSNFVYYGAALASGDGIDMAKEVGADYQDMGFVELFENGVEWKPGIAKSTYNGSMASWNVSGILVDRTGVRVVNERGPGRNIVAEQSKQEDGTLFLFMDQATFDTFSAKIGGYGISEEMLNGWLENNGKSSPVFAHADSVDGVAEIVGIDADNLKATIETYNTYVQNGVDEEFGRDVRYLTAEIGAGPYYLVEQKPRYATTLGGLTINTSLEVLDTNGDIIPNLYAIGDAGGGVRGNDSIPGADVAWALTSGYMMGPILEEKFK